MEKLSKRTIISMVIIGVWLVVIWGHSMVPANISDEESLGFLEILARVVPFELTNYMIRKTAHFTEYAILGALLYNAYYDKAILIIRKIVYATITAWFIAFFDETIQLFVEGRAGLISDVWLDLCGAVVAIILTCVIIKLRHK